MFGPSFPRKGMAVAHSQSMAGISDQAVTTSVGVSKIDCELPR